MTEKLYKPAVFVKIIMRCIILSIFEELINLLRVLYVYDLLTHNNKNVKCMYKVLNCERKFCMKIILQHIHSTYRQGKSD